MYDVTNSTCKTSLSSAETRSDFHLENDAKPPTLSIELGKDGVAQCMLEDVEANCGLKNLFVTTTNQGNQITLLVYHNIIEALTDCYCNFDVHFKMSDLTPGNYFLKVYYAKPNMKYKETEPAYSGRITLVSDKKTSINLKPEMTIPDF